ncbi:MAG: bifunctional fucokinase/L-fucose-1-P-guanylyltransferase [Clostridia bacterium]|nr:bifunctional fucokinase/L-fucose-1-P-guanylyltransferase [Clostridia bacterium]
MNNKTNYKSLFEQQSYEDTLLNYQNVLNNNTHIWDYVILTASNEAQAKGYLEQINVRVKSGQIPVNTHYAVLPDPEGKRVGSGGATLNAILYVNNREIKLGNPTPFNKRILLINSGGDSKRVPQYSACGKLFSPVPRTLPDGRRSTLFDEFMIGMSTVAPRISSGMLICSGDVLLLFNALQIDFYSKGAAVLSIKENVETGKNHGVFLKDENDNVGSFLHKQTTDILKSLGAVDDSGNVDIDTGAVILDCNILSDLCGLVINEPEKYINENARLSFYADFLYPLASNSTLEQFYKEIPEGDFTPELKECRTELWNVLSKYNMKLIRLSPASFIHFGTTSELLKLMTKDMEDYRFLGWKGNIGSNNNEISYAVSNSYISRKAIVGEGSYIEDCYIHNGSVIGKNCVLSGITLNGQTIPDNTVMHGLKLEKGRFVARMYGVNDNPKENKLFGNDIKDALWISKIYPVCDTMEEAVKKTLAVMSGEVYSGELTSLCESFNNADVTAILPWQEKLSDKVKAESILQGIDDGIAVESLKEDVNERIEEHLIYEADKINTNDISSFSRKIRIYWYLHKLTGKNEYADKCFQTISTVILQSAIEGAVYRENAKIQENEVITRLPVRVNWGGGWSDTPPYCMEHGGTVLNAAVSLNGDLPIEVTIKKLDENKIILTSTDIGAYKEFTGDITDLQYCRDPHDAFALHKAALIACGLVPLDLQNMTVEDICKNLGGGIYFNTRVINIPKGSGLGTSSILAGACVKALYRLTHTEISDEDMYNRVLCMEQLMSTGGGWQDQVGGLAPGVKMVTSRSGLKQEIQCLSLNISSETMDELNERFALIYTGQRRLARNLLREVVGKYIGNNETSVTVHYDIQRLAVLMRFELEKGNIDGFAKLLNEHWELSKKLDMGCTNTCIDQILYSISDLTEGHMICGAGGGGFLQIVLKKGISKELLRNRLREVFQDSGVAVYDCKII